MIWPLLGVLLGVAVGSLLVVLVIVPSKRATATGMRRLLEPAPSGPMSTSRRAFVRQWR